MEAMSVPVSGRMIDRRRFLQYTTGAVALVAMPWSTPALGWAAGFSTPHFEFKPINDTITAVFGEGGNCLVAKYRTPTAGLKPYGLLIDCKLSHLGYTLRREIEDQCQVRLTHVINTHHHPDHAGGNHAFNSDLHLIGHQAIKPRIEDNYNLYVEAGRRSAEAGDPPADLAEEYQRYAKWADDATVDDFLPDQLMEDNELELTLGDLKVVLRHEGAGHTDNDVYVHFPQHNVIHTGDLLFYKLHPYFDPPGGSNSVGWQTSVKAVITHCDSETVVIPGHGEITAKDGLQDQADYFDAIRNLVTAARAEGKSRAAITQMKLPGYEAYGFGQVLPRALGAVWEELAKG
ncbi:MAG: MBL fold metallo-hydrolase [Planctomycetes bacterium]|nr:MBL fold metallo-hydrolase [Planctomycetota bacterium]NOG55188.1 MBL fold metallo-hydrolase [Planctomycetota bacterium]